MKKHLFPVVFVAVLVFTAALGLGTAAAAAKTPTPTPTATSTPAPPARPSDVHVAHSTLFWTDNSSNETGFRIDLVTCQNASANTRSFRYEVPANTTSFPFPQEFLDAEKACSCPNETWTVTAFNQNGEAAASNGTGVSTCVPLSERRGGAPATPPPVAMPSTGAGERASGSNSTQMGVAGGLALMGAAALSCLCLRRRHRA
jgi:hypothetical protein